ncbi:hypothetical protein [Planococcus lenghuensis]|nr:hypothetical protein [Planococcus lenghuensis]
MAYNGMENGKAKNDKKQLGVIAMALEVNVEGYWRQNNGIRYKRDG